MSLIKGFGGGGGKGGGGGGGGASEDPNTLRSTQYATVIDALSEGPIYGLVNGAKSVYFDKVALQNADGSYNFNNASFGYTTGDIASNQHAASALTGDASNVESTSSVGVQVFQATPIIRTVTQANVDHIRVTISTPALTNTNTSNGHVSGNSASFTIAIQSNHGGFVQVAADTFSGKTTSKYSRDYLIPVSGSGPWDIKVSRTSNDDNNTFSQSQTWFDEYTAIISTKMEYRHTAVAGISIDARQFSAIPTRAYDVKGLIINVPTNYDPVGRGYTGTWDGNFKLAWSDNPAWVFYDLLTNSRYGLGNYIDDGLIDKWQLYSIAQYCDQLVPDGMGGNEPRFTCNLHLKTTQDAYRAIQDLASVFRAITYWAGGAISVVQDAPSDPIQIFSPANIIDGVFNYQGASSKAMHTVCLVTYADPNNWYQANVEYVQDDADVAKYGVIQTSISAIGCASRGQAHRLGKWLLYSERLESETISFRAGMDAVYCYPGAIIQTSDPIRAGGRMGGRVVGLSADLTTVTLDAPYQYVGGTSPTFTVMLSDGTVYTGHIISSSGNNIVLSNAISGVPVPNAMYLISQTNIEPELWRVVSISEVGEGNQLEISGVSHNPSKYGYIEEGYNLTIPSISSLSAVPSTPSNLSAFSSWYLINVGIAGIDLTVSWSGSATYYNVSYSVNNGQSSTLTMDQTSFDIQGATVGDVYTISVQAVSAIGITSNFQSFTYTVVSPPKIYPKDVTGFTANVVSNGVQLTWDDVADPMLYDYEIREGFSWDSSKSLGFFNGTITYLPPLEAANYDWFIKARNKFLNESLNPDACSLQTTKPLGLTAKSIISGPNYVLSWAAPSSMFAISHYSIAEGSNAFDLTEISQANTTQYQSRVNWLGNKKFWIAAVDVAGNFGDYTSVTVSIAAAEAMSISNSIAGTDVVLSWNKPVATLPIDYYKILSGDTLAYATSITNASTTEYRQAVQWSGNKTFWIAAVDTAGNVGVYSSVSINAAPPDTVFIGSSLKSGNYILSWSTPKSFVPISHYILGYGENIYNLTQISIARVTEYESVANWLGSRTFWIAAVDTAGNVGQYTSSQIVIRPPIAPTVTAQIVDNNVELYWTDCTSSLPIKTYSVYKGDTFATASLIGQKTGDFTTITEVFAGTYTYWVVGIDLAGNIGLSGKFTGAVSAPPNYILHADIFSEFGGTKVNAIVELGGVTMPVDTTSTWGQHFTNRGWSSPQDQINAGYPFYAEPTLLNGYYEEVVDYGATLASVNVTVTPTVSIVAGSPTYQVMISSSNTSANGPWVDHPNTTQLYLTNFRWVKVRVTVSSPDNKSFLTMTSLETKLAVSIKNDAGSAMAYAGDSGGTKIYFNQSFIGVNSINLTPQGTTSGVTPMYDFESGAYPTYFMAYLFNSQTGARVSGTVSWSAQGY